MKKRHFLSLAAALAVAMMAFTACGKSSSGGDQTVAVTGVTLSQITATLATTDPPLTLTATIAPATATDKAVSWTSSNTAVAKVTADGATGAVGVVTPVALGTATITATTQDGGKTATCAVTVPDPLTYDAGVVVGGLTWATRNVDAAGTFAANPEDPGMFYQWNRKTAWPATDAVTGWDSTYPSGDAWAAANDPCPVGWHVPTQDEQLTLLDTVNVSNVWTPLNGVNGRRFTDKTSGASIFLPAADYRLYSDGTLLSAGNYAGYYWSSSPYTSCSACLLTFYSSYAYQYNDFRTNGFSVRCVRQ